MVKNIVYYLTSGGNDNLSNTTFQYFESVLKTEINTRDPGAESTRCCFRRPSVFLVMSAVLRGCLSRRLDSSLGRHEVRLRTQDTECTPRALTFRRPLVRGSFTSLPASLTSRHNTQHGSNMRSLPTSSTHPLSALRTKLIWHLTPNWKYDLHWWLEILRQLYTCFCVVPKILRWLNMTIADISYFYLFCLLLSLETPWAIIMPYVFIFHEMNNWRAVLRFPPNMLM